MFGSPEPVPFPVRGLAKDRENNCSEFRRDGFVSIWVGHFASIEEAEAYFGIPEKIGLYLPAEAFTADFGLGDFPPETLEANFEQLAPRPLAVLLRDATFADSFRDRALEAARRQGIHEAQGVALLYDFDYRLKPDRRDVAGPVRFLGAVPFVGVAPGITLKALEELQNLARELGCPFDAVIFVLATLR